MDRLSIRHRPEGSPIMHQNWGKLLFLHFSAPLSVLRPMIPRALEIDTSISFTSSRTDERGPRADFSASCGRRRWNHSPPPWMKRKG